MRNAVVFSCLVVFATHARALSADKVQSADKGGSFAREVVPFLKAHCYKCHSGNEPEAGLSFRRYRASSNIQQDFAVWEKVLEMIGERQMPPKEQPRPKETQLQTVIQALKVELTKFECNGPTHPGRVTIRRLNRAEYNNTIRDLIGIGFRPAGDFPSDDVGNGFDNIGDVLSIPPILLEKYLSAAEAVVEKAFADEKAVKRILVHQPDDENSARDVLRRNLTEFATRAFRRPVSDGELGRLYGLIRNAREDGNSDEEAFKVSLQAILASPHFLFRVERDPEKNDPDGIRELNAYELASRLSYFLWSSMPDEELFQLAKQGTLRKPDVLKAQVKRMLHDPKARALTENFAGQWLQLRSLSDITPDPEKFPRFDEPLRSAMRRETEMFFETIVREDRSVLEFLDADFTFVNERLARHYGMSGVNGDKFRRVGLSHRRRGVLTQASILMITSNPTRTSPVKRGKWILDNILGEPPPPPPDGVPDLDENAESLGSLRERLEQHRADESCAVCHEKMDSLGFGLENFDVTGAWRDRDGRFPIDPSGTLPGKLKFRGPKDLMEILAKQKKNSFCRCLTEKMLTYALGRGLESYDRCAVDQIVKELAGHRYRFGVLVQSIIFSDPFLLRESKGAN